MVAEGDPSQTSENLLYARTSRRFRGLMIDIVIVVLLFTVTIFVVTSTESIAIRRAAGVAFLLVCLLYEPLLVSLTGGTVGHHVYNYRVVSDRTQGNINFPTAVVRMLAKGLFGWLSFVTVVTTRRHQAVHDMLTQSTVQIRDASRSTPFHYFLERTDLSDPGLPSPLRRILTISGYVVLMTPIYVAAWGSFLSLVIVPACTDARTCTPALEMLLKIAFILWAGIGVWLISLGWDGRLPGARRRDASPGGEIGPGPSIQTG